jgi:hypothetical protein
MPRRKPVAANDAIRPAARTGTQVLGPGAIIALLAAFGVISWDETQTAAVMVLAIPAWAFLQNWWENRAGRAFLIGKPGKPGGV